MRLLVAAWLVAVCGVPAFSAVMRSEGIEFSVDETWPALQSSGYAPIRCSLRNNGPERHLTLCVENRNNSTSVEKDVTIAAGEALNVALPTPVVSAYWMNEVKVRERGRLLPGLSQGMVFSGQPVAPSILIVSHRVEDLRQLNRWAGDQSGPYGKLGSQAERHIRQITPAEFPEGWISLTQIGMVLASAQSVEMMNRDRREDLRKWVATGGQLYVYGRSDTRSDPIELLLGKGAPHDVVKGGSDTTVVHYFGVVRVTDRELFAEGGIAPVDWNTILRPGWVVPKDRYGLASAPSLTIPGVGAIPVTVFTILVTLFAVGIGPVHYFMLRRKKKLHLMFVTTPLAAVGVTVAMSAYGLFSEGLSTRGRVISHTFLDESRHEAVTLGKMAVYAGTSPGSMTFPADTAVFPAGGEVGRGVLLLNGGRQVFRGGWVPPRTLVNYVTASVAPARGRLKVKRASGGLVVANELGADIREIWLRDESGKTYTAVAIKSGTSVTAAPAPAGDQDGGRRILKEIWFAIPVAAHMSLGNGHYVAELSSSPHFDTGLGRISHIEDRNTICGTFTEAN